MERAELYEQALRAAIEDLEILCGDRVGSVAWQEVAGTAAVNLRSLASVLEALREGKTRFRGSPLEGVVSFASPHE